LTAGQKLTALDDSFNAYVKAKQAGNWAGKVSSGCVNSPMMKKWTAKLILASTQDDIKFSKMFWKGALELNMAIGRGKNSRFAKFLGKKILGIKAAKKLTKKLRVKAGLKVKGKVGLKLKLKGKKTTKKAGLKLKLKGKKTTKKAGLKLKIGAKKPKAKAGLKLKIGAKKPKTKLKVKAKVGAKAKVSVKKPKAKASLKIKAKKSRRLQTTAPATTAASTTPSMNVSSNGVNLADAQFQANVPQPTALAGDGQSSPSKSWMMFAGMMTLVALLFN